MLDGSISGEYLYNYDKIRISQLRLKTQRLSFKEVEIWNIKKHMSNFYSLFYVYGGSAMIYLNNKKFEVPNHSLVVADRGDVIAGCMLENNETFRIAIDFKPELFDNVNNAEADFSDMLNSVLRLQNKNDFKLPDSYYYYDKTGYLQELFENSLAEYRSRKFRWDEIVKGNILETLILIARDLELDNKNLPPDFIQIIVDYIEININKRIKVKDIAQKFNYSESYVTKAFKKATGMPLAEFIRQKKIYKATSIISNDNLKIENIAEMLGFDSYATFNRCFKKYLGISPSEYKSKVKNATDWFVGMEDLITQSKL